MVAVMSRQGRETQRYTEDGGRRVVGCIPYRFKMGDDIDDQEVEVLIITSQKGHGMMFPKGGWENDETITQAASREAMEEAGVQGQIGDVLDEWTYRSRRYGSFYEATMFPLNVTKELPHWPEMAVRKRRWVSVAEAMEGCEHGWMKEALQRLVMRLSSSRRQETSSCIAEIGNAPLKLAQAGNQFVRGESFAACYCSEKIMMRPTLGLS